MTIVRKHHFEFEQIQHLKVKSLDLSLYQKYERLFSIKNKQELRLQMVSFQEFKK